MTEFQFTKTKPRYKLRTMLIARNMNESVRKTRRKLHRKPANIYLLEVNNRNTKKGVKYIQS